MPLGGDGVYYFSVYFLVIADEVAFLIFKLMEKCCVRRRRIRQTQQLKKDKLLVVLLLPLLKVGTVSLFCWDEMINLVLVYVMFSFI